MKIITNFLKRYEKQLLLPEIGLCGQKKIIRTRIVCVGSGGLAATALPYLVAAGIGTLGIIDFDTVELSNLHRQTLYTTQQLKQSKTLCTKKYLEKINPNVHFKIYNTKLTEKNVQNILKNFDIVIDGTDNIKTKILINKIAVKQNIPMIYGAAAGYTGQVTTFYSKKGPCYNCLYPKNTLQKNKNDACGLGVLGPVPGLIGCLQAMECLNLILQKNKREYKLSTDTLIGTLLTFDLKKYDIQRHTITKKNTCTACYGTQHNKTSDIKFIDKQQVSLTKKTYKKIKHFTFNINLTKKKSKETKHTMYINYEKFFLLTQIPKKLMNIKKKKILVVTCDYGIKSKNIVVFLKSKLKFLHVYFIRD